MLHLSSLINNFYNSIKFKLFKKNHFIFIQVIIFIVLLFLPAGEHDDTEENCGRHVEEDHEVFREPSSLLPLRQMLFRPSLEKDIFSIQR